MFREHKNAAFDTSGKDKVFLKVRDVLEKDFLVTHGDVVKEHQVLVNLTHIANVRHHRDSKNPTHQAYGQELADAADAYTVDLNK